MHYKKIFLTALSVLLFVYPINIFAINLREELLFSVVQILSISETGDIMTGSGSTISKDGLVLTNYHVVANPETEKPHLDITICYTISQYEVPRCAATAKIIALNKEFDLALIEPDKKIDKSGKPTNISFKKTWKKSGNSFYAVPFKNTQSELLPNILDRINVWGYPAVGGSTITITSGFASGFFVQESKDKKTLLKFIKADAEINPGNSGGAAFDRYFSFIGVPSNAWAGQLGFIIPVKTVVEWLKNLNEKGIINIRKIDSVKTAQFTFSDIAAADPFLNIALLMRHLQIMKGYPDNTFRPEQALRYAETAAILIAAKRIPLDYILSSSCVINNADQAAWFYNYICFAKSNGWISEKNDPLSFITEKEFYNLLEKIFEIRLFKNVSSAEYMTRGKAGYAIYDLISPY